MLGIYVSYMWAVVQKTIVWKAAFGSWQDFCRYSQGRVLRSSRCQRSRQNNDVQDADWRCDSNVWWCTPGWVQVFTV